MVVIAKKGRHELTKEQEFDDASVNEIIDIRGKLKGEFHNG